MTEDYQSPAGGRPKSVPSNLVTHCDPDRQIGVRAPRLGANPLPHQRNEFVLLGGRCLRVWKNHLATVLPNHFQQPVPFRGIKIKVLPGQPKALNDGTHRVVQRLKEGINHLVSI
jgi:hypothetical protein